MKLGKLSTLAGALLSAAALLIGSAQAQDPVKVGFVYVGPVGDHGWTYRHDIGRQAVDEAFGDKVETTYVESVKEGPDAERVIRQLATSGHDLIFTTSFGFMNPTLKVAKRFPKVRFEHATGYKRSKNLSTYMARFYEGRYVAGIIAGQMTKSGVVGYIGSFPIPEVVRGINAVTLAARAVNPEITTRVIWVNSWYDPGKEAAAAKALIAQGADIIMQHTDSPAPIQVAESRGVWAVGQASNMSAFGSKAHLTAIIDNWAPYYVARVKAVMDGTWTSVNTWDGIGAGMVGIGEISDAVPADVKASALALQASLADGSYHAFTGPLNKQDGSVWLAAGETADDGTLAGMGFYVEGIEGAIPN